MIERRSVNPNGVTTMDVIAASFEVDLVPGSSLGFATTLFLLLLVAYIAVRGTVAVGDKLTPIIWPSLAFFGVAMVAILYSQARSDGDVVRVTTETDRLSVESVPSGPTAESPSSLRTYQHDHDGLGPHTHNR